MAERRMLSKTISTSRKVNRLPDRAALLYTWLIPHTDEFGRMEGDAMSIKAKIVPMRSISEQEVEQDLALMIQNDLISIYEVKNEKYIEISNFESFQTFKNDRPRKGEYPDKNGEIPCVIQKETTGIQEIPNGNFVRLREGKGREEKVSKGKGREEKAPYTSLFEDFWKIYPKRVGKPKAFDYWKRLSEAQIALIFEDIPKRLKSDSWINGFAHHPERYLRDKRWEDEIILPRVGGRNQQPIIKDKYNTV